MDLLHNSQRKFEAENRYYQDPNRCPHCDEKITYEKRRNKFCNSSCAAKYYKTGSKRKRGAIPCLHCGLPIRRRPSKYCSFQCSVDHRWVLTKQIIFDTQEITGTRVAKRYLTEIHGSKCSVCGVAEWEGKSLVMILDHINGHAHDWRIINLRLICPNCDSQTGTYKGRNKGNGRHSRRERYKSGKSY